MFPNIHDFLQMEAESTDLDTFTGCWKKFYLDVRNKLMDPEDQELNQPWFLMVLMALDSVLLFLHNGRICEMSV